MKVIDATDLIMGRMASNIAKELMQGEEIIVVNAEESVVSGNRKMILGKYSERRARKSIVNPARHGPKFPRRPDAIVRRTVRGMLPYKKTMGRKAYKSLKVYVGVPDNYKDADLVSVEGANLSKLATPKFMRVKEISKLLGATF